MMRVLVPAMFLLRDSDLFARASYLLSELPPIKDLRQHRCRPLLEPGTVTTPSTDSSPLKSLTRASLHNTFIIMRSRITATQVSLP